MPYQFHEAFNPNKLSNTQYGFFTMENGSSTGGYVVNGETTRNVNLYSPQDKDKPGYDPAESVLSNLMKCFAELTHGNEGNSNAHKFVMTSNYGVGGARIISCQSFAELTKLKETAALETEALKFHPDIQSGLIQNNISVIKADSFVFKGIPGELIAAGGASGDAHPIILIDEQSKVCAYISGAHAALKEGVIEKTIESMVAMGADRKKIHLVIGPGLGKNSYEFGVTKRSQSSDDYVTPEEYLNVPADKVTRVQDNSKRLLDIEKIVKFKAMGLISPENIHNIDIDTMGFNLYESGKRRSTVNFDELHRQGLLFFGARRKIMEDNGLTAEDPGLHNTVGRHFAGITVKE